MPFYPISTLHAWNSHLIPSLGLPLNLLLFWLVWTKTPKEMRVYSRILLQTCIVDLVFLSVSFVATPVLVFQGSISIVIFDGYFARVFASIFNHNTICLVILNAILNVCFFFDIFSISVQFVHRYLILNRDIRVSLRRYLLMLTLPLVASLIVGTFYALSISETTVLNEEQKTALTDYIDWDNSIYIIFTSNENIWMLESFVGMIITYSINIFCGLKVVKFVGSHGGFNPRMKELNQQLTKNLIILALSPLLSFLFIIIIFMLIMAMRITGMDLTKTIMFVQYFAFLIVNWLPAANPMASIWINRPYRDAVKKLFICMKKNKITTLTPVKPLSLQTTG